MGLAYAGIFTHIGMVFRCLMLYNILYIFQLQSVLGHALLGRFFPRLVLRLLHGFLGFDRPPTIDWTEHRLFCGAVSQVL